MDRHAKTPPPKPCRASLLIAALLLSQIHGRSGAASGRGSPIVEMPAPQLSKPLLNSEPPEHRTSEPLTRKQLEFVHENTRGKWWRPRPAAITENDLDALLGEYRAMVGPDSSGPNERWPLLRLQSEVHHSGHHQLPAHTPSQHSDMDLFLDGFIRPANNTSALLRKFEYGDGLLKCRHCGGYGGSTKGDCCRSCGQLQYDGCWCRACDCFCYFKSETPIRYAGELRGML